MECAENLDRYHRAGPVDLDYRDGHASSSEARGLESARPIP